MAVKKLLGIVVLGILLSSSVFALPLRDGKDNRVYNIFIKDYNKFVSEYKSEVIDYCNSVSTGANIITVGLNCEYNEIVNLARRHVQILLSIKLLNLIIKKNICGTLNNFEKKNFNI